MSFSPPTGDVALAVSVLHEFQHGKLGAVLNLVPMYADDGARRIHAPWRDDPRPPSGVFQGMYAFLGIIDFWRVRAPS